MPHQCIHCSKLYENAAPELLTGCSCGGRFFFFIKESQFERLKSNNVIIELKEEEKERIEKDVRDMIGITEEEPVILDLESVRVLKPGKFEIDIVSLFNKNRPIVFKLEEGKYIIDLSSNLKVSEKEINRVIKNPVIKKKKK